MKKITHLFIALLVSFHINAQEDIKLPGLVVEQNSKFNTGKVVYLSNAQIKSAGATPQLSDNQGKFTLIFVDKPIGNVTRVFASKTDYEVVNDEVLKRAAVLGRKQPLKVVMCKAEALYENQITYYNIARDAYLETYKERAAILEKEGKERNQLMAQMEREFDQKIETVAKANELLLNQLNAAQAQAKDLADKWLTVNLDDQSETYQEAYRRFLEKDIDGALKILEQVNLEERLAKQQAIIDTIQKKRQQDIEQCLFKAELHRLKYEFDKVEEMYELALKYDSENPEILFRYALYLQKQNQLNQAHPLYVKSLNKYRQLAQSNSQTYLPNLATTLKNLAVLQYHKNEFKQAEKSFQEALEIYRKLAQDNPQTYLPEIAITLNNFGLLQYSKNEFKKAQKSYKEALEIYRKLVQFNLQTYLPNAATTLNNLANLQSDKNEFKQAEKNYEEALTIYRKLTQVNPQIYLPDIGLTLNNLAILQRKKNEFEQAKKSYQEALEIYQKLAQVNPQAYLSYVAATSNNLGALHHSKNEFEQAEKPYKETLEIYRKLAQDNPQTYLPYVALTLTNLAVLYIYKNEFEQAEKSQEEALEIYRKLAQDNPQTYLPNLAVAQINISAYYQKYKINKELSIQLVDEAITNLLPFYEIPYVQDYLGNAFIVLRHWDIDVEKYMEEKLKDMK